MGNRQEESSSREYIILEGDFDQVAKIFSMNSKVFEMHYELLEGDTEKVLVVVKAEESELLQIDRVLNEAGLVY